MRSSKRHDHAVDGGRHAAGEREIDERRLRPPAGTRHRARLQRCVGGSEDGSRYRDHAQRRVERVHGGRDTVIRIAVGVRHHGCLLDGGRLDELLREGHAREPRRIRPAIQIQRSRLERGEDKTRGELVGDVEDVRAHGSSGERAVAQRLELAALPEVEHQRDHLGVVMFDQPGDGLVDSDRIRSEAMRLPSPDGVGIRQHDAGHSWM